MRGNILPESLARHVEHRREFLVYLLQRFNIIVGLFQRMLLREFSLLEGFGEDLLELRDEHGKDLVQLICWNLLVEIQFSLDDSDYSLFRIVEGLLLLSFLNETG